MVSLYFNAQKYIFFSKQQNSFIANVKTKVALLPLPYPALSTEKPYTTITLLITYNCEKEKQSTLLVRYFLAIF